MNKQSDLRISQHSRWLSMPGRDVIVPPRASRPTSVPTADLNVRQKSGTLAAIDTLTYRSGMSKGYPSIAKPRSADQVGLTASKLQSNSLSSTSPSLPANSASMTTVSRTDVNVKRNNLKRTSWFKPKFFKVSSSIRYALVIVIILATTYVGIDVIQTNTQLKKDLTKSVSALGSPSEQDHQDNEGKDETPVPASAIDSYKVAPTLPRVITIANAKVRARVLSMDVNPDNSIQAPINISDAGWYTGSAKPGEPGAALIDAHVSGLTGRALFADLKNLSVSNRIEIERGDGQKFIYEVVHIETVLREKVDMGKLLRPYGGAPQGLNLITCAGKFVKDSSTYDHRLVVYAKLISQVIQ